MLTRTAQHRTELQPAPSFSHMDTLVQSLPMVLGLLAWVYSGVWAYVDARNRGKPPLFVALLVMFVAWPLGIVIWIVLRPEKRPPSFNLDDYRVQ